MKPRFSIGDIVQFQNEYSFNPSEKVVTVGVIRAIHFRTGLDPTRKYGKDILYVITGFNNNVEENRIQPYGVSQ